MLGSVNFYSRPKDEGRYLQRLASTKNFFKPFRLLKWASYSWGTEVQPIVGAIKAMEAPFNIPKMLANGADLLNPHICYWKKIPRCIKTIGSGARSLLWIHKQAVAIGVTPILSDAASVTLEKVSIAGKILAASWQTAEAASRLAELARTHASSEWKTRQLKDAKIAWGLKLIKSIFTLLIAVGLALALVLGITAAAPLLLCFYTITLILSIVGRFFDKNPKKCPPDNLWGTLAWQ